MPWHVDKNSWDGTEYWVVKDEAGAIICQEPTEFSAYASGAFITPEGEIKNANLIAVAPEMLAALKRAIPILRYVTETSTDIPEKEIFAAYEAALAAADD